MPEIEAPVEVVEADDEADGYLQYGDGAWISLIVQGLIKTVVPPLDKLEDMLYTSVS